MTTPDPTQNETSAASASADAPPSPAPAEHAVSAVNGSKDAPTNGNHGDSAARGPAHGATAGEAAHGEAAHGEAAASSAAAADHADHEGEGDEGETGGAETAGAEGTAAGPAGEKKRRRRRRRKKHGAQAGAEGAAPAGEETHAAEAAEGGEAHATGSLDAPANGSKGAEAAAKQGKRKDRKPGPPRERPPVNAGDIVFGKITTITDDAILIDIPGKARAIFDRREMLITDEEEPRPADAPAGEPALEAHASEAHELPAHEGSAHEASSDAAATHEGAAEAIATEPAAAEAPAAEAAAPADGEGAHDATAEAAHAAPAEAEPEGAHDAPAAEATKDPKVPHVILEVGADFIGVVHNDGARGGLVVLTHHPRRYERAKGAVEKAFNEKTLIEGLVTGVIKGGIEVDVDGLRAFAPGSHVELRLGSDLSHLVAQRLPFTVTQYAKRGRDVVLSRRSMLEEEAKRNRNEALAKLKVGEAIDGVVRSVVAFGAFVDVGGVEGLVPLQEMSHNRADGPSDVFKVGETTRVIVTKVDDKGKVWLSHRATIPDPWQQVAKKYAAGTRHTGKVVRIQPFGAFIELESGIDGLLHTADLSIKRIETPDEVVKVGDSIDVVVAHVDPHNHRIALHAAPQGAAVDEAPQKVVPHKGVKAKIEQIESGGLVVRILGVTGRNARGYVTAAGTGTPRGTELRKSFNVGQTIDAKVIEIDPRRGEVKLSIKALSDDQERSAYQQYRQQLKAEAKFTFGDLLAKKGLPPR
jgi:small subunit ribosomal protein S1